jgi:hypothetical protein
MLIPEPQAQELDYKREDYHAIHYVAGKPNVNAWKHVEGPVKRFKPQREPDFHDFKLPKPRDKHENAESDTANVLQTPDTLKA